VTDADLLAQRFEDNRGHLRAVAYRMLGSMAEAEDTVQDAWLRVARTDASHVDNLGGWLTTIVARLALDRLRTRVSRREDSIDVLIPDPIVTSPDAEADPEQAALLADSVGLAMLVVLEQLSPAERLAFVLHDTFGLPFEEIAPIVERSPTATRQLASRARRRVRGASSTSQVSRARQRELIEAFIAAAREGDFDRLLQILDPEVVARADTGPLPNLFGRSRVVRGAENVAQQAFAFRNVAAGARHADINGAPGVVVFLEDRPYAVVGFAFAGVRIVEMDFLTDRERLERLDLSAVSPAP
jgi:RNA polymerase sigma factor (sigma-70 family)